MLKNNAQKKISWGRPNVSSAFIFSDILPLTSNYFGLLLCLKFDSLFYFRFYSDEFGDNNWHKLRFDVNSSYITLYSDCKRINTLPIGKKLKLSTDGLLTIGGSRKDLLSTDPFNVSSDVSLSPSKQ